MKLKRGNGESGKRFDRNGKMLTKPKRRTGDEIETGDELQR